MSDTTNNNNQQPQITVTTAPVNQQQAPNDPNNINVDQFVNETNTEIGNENAALDAKNAKKLLIKKALNSLNKFSNNVVKNVETNEIIGEYLEYLPDNDGKTVYDYMKDPEVSKHLQYVFPKDHKEGDKLTAPITPVWIDPYY